MDKVISTLALHWVPSLDDSIKELKRILKINGSIDILMIDKDDGRINRATTTSQGKLCPTFRYLENFIW